MQETLVVWFLRVGMWRVSMRKSKIRRDIASLLEGLLCVCAVMLLHRHIILQVFLEADGNLNLELG
jgi:hypothetical protein